MGLQVGNVNNFDYFYFEALAKSGHGLPVTATMSLYGLGGGFHYNMDRTNRAVTTIDGYQNVIPPQQPGPGYSLSGLVYTPQKGKIGFSATLVFGLTGGDAAAAAFNGYLTLWMTFTKSNGIEKMGLNGGGYAMQPLNNRNAATFTGQFDITIKSLSRSIQYTVVATDYHYNTSAYAKAFNLKLPDLVAPSAPRWAPWSVEGDKVKLN